MILIKIGLRGAVLLLLVVASAWFIISAELVQTRGVRVTNLSDKAVCENLLIGDLITDVNGNTISDVGDFERALAMTAKGSLVRLSVSVGLASCTALENGDIGIGVHEVGPSSIFGKDVVGGEKLTLYAQEGMTSSDAIWISDLLSKRADTIGLVGLDVIAKSEKVEISGSDEKNLGDLLIDGTFEGVIEIVTKFSEGESTISVGSSSYKISKVSEGVSFDGKVYEIGDLIDMGGVEFRLSNFTNKSASLEGIVFRNGDVSALPGGSSYASYDKPSGKYQFNIPIKLSEAASLRFSQITDGLPVVYGPGYDILDGLLVYYLDGESVSALTIPQNIAGARIDTISVIGEKDSLDEAVRMTNLLKMSLNGNVGKTLFIESVDRVDGEIFYTIVLGCFSVLAIVASGVFLYIKQRSKMGALSASLAVFLEIFLTVGLLSSFGMQIDSQSVFALCSMCVISVIQTVLVSERTLNGRFAKAHSKFTMIIIAAGFVLLFTPFTKSGVIILVWEIISCLLTKPMIKSS